MNTTNARETLAVLINQERALCEQLQDAHESVHLNIKLGQKYLTDEQATRTWGRIESVERELGKVRSQLHHARRVDPIFNPEAASWEKLLDQLSGDMTGAFETAVPHEVAFATA